VLGAIVIGLGIATSLSNRRLVEGLASGDASSFALLADRQDAYIFLQSEPASTRLRVARALADWDDPAAAKLALTLVPDPDPGVRATLLDSLHNAARRNSRAIATEFSTGGAAESAALVEAASRDPDLGTNILEQVLEEHPVSANGHLLAKRLGPRSEPLLFPLLKHSDPEVRLSAAETISSLGLDARAGRRVAGTLLEMYRTAGSVSAKDRLLPLLAVFPQREAAEVFREVAFDYTAPSDLRATATLALTAIGDPIVARLVTDSDTAVSAAASR
jgi:HEAT repeat protein